MRSESHKKSKNRYITSLDGLRALAVLAVIAYHLGYSWMEGGLLGVTVFFVLSGFLITGLLFREWDRDAKIDLKAFWMRRVRRLFPAIGTVIIVVAALCVIFNHPLLTKMRPDIIPCLGFVQNWWYVFRGLSYFEALGSPSPLTHFWSLAIEEQFYLVWPCLLLLMLKLGRSRTFIRNGCLILAVASAVLMAVLFDPQADPTRVYYGTDTRAFSLLIGAFLALAWPVGLLNTEKAKHIDPSLQRMLDGVGVVALILILLAMVFIEGTSPFMYYGGLFGVSLLSAFLIAVLSHPSSRLARVFEFPPLVLIGKCSYGMYLWHFPIILLLRPLNPTGDVFVWWLALIVVALTFGVSYLSFRFVEDPIRKGGLNKFFLSLRDKTFELQQMLNAKVLAPTLVVAACLVVALVGCVAVPDTSLVPEEAIVSTGAAADEALKVEKPAKNSPTKGKHTKGVEAPLLIGDSVPGDLGDAFEKRFPYGLNDSFIGRWFFQARDVYKDYEKQGVVGDTVIFASFSNHKLQPDELDKMFKIVGTKRQIFLVGIVTPEKFNDDTNRKLESFAAEHDTVHYVDWPAVCDKAHKKEYLWDDETHITPKGASAYADMLADALKPYLKKDEVK